MMTINTFPTRPKKVTTTKLIITEMCASSAAVGNAVDAKFQSFDVVERFQSFDGVDEEFQ